MANMRGDRLEGQTRDKGESKRDHGQAHEQIKGNFPFDKCMANGRKRGRPKGSKGKATLDKEAAREVLREMVKARLVPMTTAQLDNATGIRHLMLRDPKTGKFERVTDEAGIDAALASEGQAVWIYTKDPSVQAFTDLMNRTLDKPVETLQATVTVAGIEQRLKEARRKVNG